MNKLWIRMNGEPVGIAPADVPALYYIELEEQGGPTAEELEGRSASSMKALTAYAYMARRMAGETLTYRQAAADVRMADFLGYGESPTAAADPQPAPQDGAEVVDLPESSGDSATTSTAA